MLRNLIYSFDINSALSEIESDHLSALHLARQSLLRLLSMTLAHAQQITRLRHSMLTLDECCL